MAMTLTTSNTILGALQPKSASARLVSNITIVLLGTLLLALSAHIKAVFPIPFTLQSLTVAVLAAAFGARIGVATVALYIVEGLSGLPVFTNGGGAAYVFSPTFGFLVGYLPMAYIIGSVADRGASDNILKLFAAMILGNAVSFTLGYFWLVALAGSVSWIDQTNVMASAFAAAVQPFIVWDILKMAFAAVTVAGGWQLVKSRKA